MKKIFTPFLLLFLFGTVTAQTYQVELVKNLNPVTGSNPRWFTEFNGSLYFFANDGVNLHKMFSVTGNNQPVLCPNITGNAVFGDGTTSTNRLMGVMNNKLFLPILGNPIGREPYSYDGINLPVLLLDISPGNGSSGPCYFLTHDHKLYFQASSPATGSELWMHDSATNITQCLTDINPGPLHSTIAFITVYNNKLYFAGSNGNDTTLGNTGLELYSYDPATATVSLVWDINPGYLPSNPTALMVANNKLYFVAQETVYGKELYEFDGVNVTRLTDFNPGAAQGVYTSDQSFPTFFNNSIYFAANEPNNDINLGRYDLSNNTATVIYCSGAGISGIPRYFKVFDNKLFFQNYSDTSGSEVWCTDGIAAPFQAWDVNPGLSGSNCQFFTVYDSSLYFNAFNDTTTAEELFRLSRKPPVVEPNGIMENAQVVKVTLTPNPVSDYLWITVLNSAEAISTMRIYDVFGRNIRVLLLEDQQRNFTKKIDVSELSGGTYFVVLNSKTGDRVYSQKIIKK